MRLSKRVDVQHEDKMVTVLNGRSVVKKKSTRRKLQNILEIIVHLFQCARVMKRI